MAFRYGHVSVFSNSLKWLTPVVNGEAVTGVPVRRREPLSGAQAVAPANGHASNCLLNDAAGLADSAQCGQQVVWRLIRQALVGKGLARWE